MKKILKAAICLTLAVCCLKAFAKDEEGLLPVLVYHHIEEKISSDVSCTPKQFEAQLKTLLDNGFAAVDLCKAADFLSGSYNKKDKPVLITFDDGYESVYEHAFKIAKKLKVHITVFVITSRIGQKPQFARYLSEKQIKEMYESGYVDFGSHTHDLHTAITRIYDAFKSKKNNPVVKLAKKDLKTSAARLKKITGAAPISIAWPYGSHNAALTEAARSNGFKLHFTSVFGYNQKGSNPFSIKRIPISSRDTPQSVLKKAKGTYPHFL